MQSLARKLGPIEGASQNCVDWKASQYHRHYLALETKPTPGRSSVIAALFAPVDKQSVAIYSDLLAWCPSR